MLRRAHTFLRRLFFGRTFATADVTAGADERRVWVRHAADVSARCGPAARDHGEAPLLARVTDVSVAGARLVAGRPFHPADLISIELPTQGGKAVLAVLAVVVHAAPRPDGQWALGCRFSRDLTDEDLRAFGFARPTGGVADLPPETELTALYRTSAGADPVPHRVPVAGLTPGGVVLCAEEEIALGALLAVRLCGPTGGQSPELLACVVRVVEGPDGRRLVGCDFIRELTDEELRTVLEN